MVRDKGTRDVGTQATIQGSAKNRLQTLPWAPQTQTRRPARPWADDGPLKVIELCRSDDTIGDGIPDTDYVALVTVDETGALSTLGTYTADLTRS
ncbi:hypothetical protein [Streptomyces sp. NPDC004675]|uniref:hypothetical protein n=1 Tax=Streptomyces sp. NPDC004675 TaxID=3154286 RepID=UPI0033AFCAC1